MNVKRERETEVEEEQKQGSLIDCVRKNMKQAHDEKQQLNQNQLEKRASILRSLPKTPCLDKFAQLCILHLEAELRTKISERPRVQLCVFDVILCTLRSSTFDVSTVPIWKAWADWFSSMKTIDALDNYDNNVRREARRYIIDKLQQNITGKWIARNPQILCRWDGNLIFEVYME